jgi:uncharacterized protein (DUF2384 family)
MDELRRRAEEVVSKEADALDTEHVDALVRTAEMVAIRFNRSLPPYLNPADVAEIRGILIDALGKIREEDESQPLDLLDEFLVRAESIRHILRDALDDELPVNADDAEAVLEQITVWLPGIPKKQIAELLGVDLRTMQRWEKDGSRRTPRRLYIVAKLVNLLKDAWTPEGVVAWFSRPRHDLDGKTPLDVLDDPMYERSLFDAVREGRAQHAS